MEGWPGLQPGARCGRPAPFPPRPSGPGPAGGHRTPLRPAASQARTRLLLPSGCLPFRPAPPPCHPAPCGRSLRFPHSSGGSHL